MVAVRQPRSSQFRLFPFVVDIEKYTDGKYGKIVFKSIIWYPRGQSVKLTRARLILLKPKLNICHK